jgi:hypothetical protein
MWRIHTEVDEQVCMDTSSAGEQELELALLRRGVDALAAGCERCSHCGRAPLIGERIYVYTTDAIRCELCRAMHRERPLASRIVHGPEFGHTMRIIDQRAVA